MRNRGMRRGSMGSDTRRADMNRMGRGNMNMGRGEMGTPVNSQGICPPGKTLCEDGMCYHDIGNCHSHEPTRSRSGMGGFQASSEAYNSRMMESGRSYRRGGGTRGVGRSQRNPKGNPTKRQQLSNRGKTYIK